jgi:outer membrane biosynthesis protein TonB
MMTVSNSKEEENRKKGLIISVIFHALLVLILFLPLLKYPDPPPGQEGILVSFGQPNMGQGDSRPDTQQEEVVEPKPPSEVEKPTEVKSEPKPTPPVETQKEVVTVNDPNEVAIRKKEEEKKRQEDAEKRKVEDDRRKAAEEAERQRKADEAAKQAELEKAKKQFGDAFGGKGKGNTDKAGNQGDPKGDPDAKNLEGISTGSGNVGGGLSGRGVQYKPTIQDKFQRTGTVVVNVCVDRNGNVVSATFTQRGSTINDSELNRIAETNAMKFKFSSSSIDQQCGTITFNFRAQ